MREGPLAPGSLHLQFARSTDDYPLRSAGSVVRQWRLGEAKRARDDELADVRDAYLARHPRAATNASFADFAFHRLDVTELRLVAGFGRMGWVHLAEYVRI